METTPSRPPYAIRLSMAERRLIAKAAAHRGLAISAYIRSQALVAARSDLALHQARSDADA